MNTRLLSIIATLLGLCLFAEEAPLSPSPPPPRPERKPPRPKRKPPTPTRVPRTWRPTSTRST